VVCRLKLNFPFPISGFAVIREGHQNSSAIPRFLYVFSKHRADAAVEDPLMTMQDFLTLFYMSAETRRQALVQAQNAGGNHFNDLAFLAAVQQWRGGKHGKKNALQIHIIFFIAVRGGGTPNPYAISPVLENPVPACVTVLGQAMIPIMHQNRENKGALAEIEQVKAGGGLFGAIKAYHKSNMHKLGASSRTVSIDLFEPVVAAVTAAASPLGNWVAGVHAVGGPGNLNRDQGVNDLIRMLERGQAGGHMDAADMGLF
jgi:hypothetical protein